jgi:hypothetical protein
MENAHVKRKMIRRERKRQKQGEKVRKKKAEMKKRRQTKMNDFGWGGEEGCYMRKESQSRRTLQPSFCPPTDYPNVPTIACSLCHESFPAALSLLHVLFVTIASNFVI